MYLNKSLIISIFIISLFSASLFAQEKNNDALPVFKGNTKEEFSKYIFSKIDKSKYQDSRKIFLELKTDEGGKVIDCNVKNGNYEEAKEIIEIVKKMPTWSPAKKDGKSIPYTFIVPLSFK